MRKKIIRIIIAILLISLIKSNGQSINNDSLNKLNQNPSSLKIDSTQVLALINIANTYDRNIDSGLAYSFKAAALARKIKYHVGEMSSLLLIEVILRHSGNVVNAFNVASQGLKIAVEYKNYYYQAQFSGETGIILGASIILMTP